ncbi:MAG: folate-binding protein YgfZ [Gammaproteobacteria bacterium]
MTTSNSSALLKLDQYDLIEISGGDALEFLHNQFTNDLKKLPQNSFGLAAWCSIKGRVIYSFRIWRRENVFYLILLKSQTETFVKKLRMFILRSDVTVNILENKFVYGLYGNNSDQLISNSNELNHVSEINDQIMIKLAAQTSRYLIITEDNNLELYGLSIQADQKPFLNQWNLLGIEEGLPEITPETADMFLPQMLDFERLGGLSFQKGCYPGQEIVARVKYRGELKKQLYRAEITSENEISEGMSLVLADDGVDKLVGHIVNYALTDPKVWAALVVININTSESSEIKLQSDKHSQCIFTPL